MSEPSAPAADQPWLITQRWQQYEGELRTNVLRLGTIGLFYCIHLLRYWTSQGTLGQWLQLEQFGAVTPRFHLQVTLLVAAWAALACGIQLCLTQRVFPRWLPAASTCLDLVMLTFVHLLTFGVVGVMAALLFDWRRPIGLGRFAAVVGLCFAAFFATVALSGSLVALEAVGATTVVLMNVGAAVMIAGALRFISTTEAEA